MKTLHKIYLFVIVICFLLYNLYSISNKNKEGFFFGYSPIYNWNRPLELPKDSDVVKQHYKDKWEEENEGSEMSYEEYMRKKKEEEEDNEEECKELMKDFKGVCEDRDNSKNLLDKCPDECEKRKLEWEHINKTDTMKQAAIKDEEDKEKQQQVIDAKKNLKDALQKRLLPTNLPDIKRIPTGNFNDINDSVSSSDISSSTVDSLYECNVKMKNEGSKYMLVNSRGSCKILNKKHNHKPKYKIFKKNDTPEYKNEGHQLWEYVNDYTYDIKGNGDLKKGQYIGHMNKTLEECKKMGIGNKSKYIAWTGNRAYEPGYCKVLIKKYNKNPDLTTNRTPDASFNLFKFTGKYEKKPSDEIYNSLLKPMTGRPFNPYKYTVLRRMRHNIDISKENEDLSESERRKSAYKKIFNDAYQIKAPMSRTIISAQEEGSDVDGKWTIYKIDILANTKPEINRIKAFDQPDKFDYFGNIKEESQKEITKEARALQETFQVHREKEGFITREGHKNCGKNHKEKFMNISRSQEIFDIMHTLTELDKIDMDK
tara:strand:- start:1414 stop:3033 length:1620 start_codon:yes stop_codon:yes gene_type:complete